MAAQDIGKTCSALGRKSDLETKAAKLARSDGFLKSQAAKFAVDCGDKKPFGSQTR